MYGRYTRNAKKIADTQAQITFLTRCTQQHIISPSFISKTRFFTQKSQQLELDFARQRIREQLNHLHAKLFTLKFQYDLAKDSNQNSPKYSTRHPGIQRPNLKRTLWNTQTKVSTNSSNQASNPTHSKTIQTRCC